MAPSSSRHASTAAGVCTLRHTHVTAAVPRGSHGARRFDPTAFASCLSLRRSGRDIVYPEGAQQLVQLTEALCAVKRRPLKGSPRRGTRVWESSVLQRPQRHTTVAGWNSHFGERGGRTGGALLSAVRLLTTYYLLLTNYTGGALLSADRRGRGRIPVAPAVSSK